MLSLGRGLALTEVAPPFGSIVARVKAGDSFAPLGGVASFTRPDAATCATQSDAAGLPSTVLANILRDAHYVAGVRTVLLESTKINNTINPQNFGATWTAQGGASRTPGAFTGGSLSLDTLNDTSAAALMYFQDATSGWTGDGVKTLSLYFVQGTSISTAFRHRDTTAGANRALGVITWVGATPTVTLTTGTLVALEQVGTIGGQPLWRATIRTTAVTAANGRVTEFFPASTSGLGVAGVGTLNVGGVQTEDAAFASSYIINPGAARTRADDALSLTGVSVPGAATLFYRYWDLATRAWVNAAAAYVSGAAITPPVDRAYAEFAVLRDTLSAAAAAAALGY